MQVIENTIAKKYAIAFLNLFEKKLTIGCLKSFESFSRFLDANKLFSATLSIPSISLKNKIATLEIICTKQNINPLITKIIILLLRNKRIEILDKVIKSILFFHKKRLQVQKFIISTSHTLDEKEKEEISCGENSDHLFWDSCIRSKATNNCDTNICITNFERDYDINECIRDVAAKCGINYCLNMKESQTFYNKVSCIWILAKNEKDCELIQNEEYESVMGNDGPENRETCLKRLREKQ